MALDVSVGGEAEEGFVDVATSFPADAQAAEAVQPGNGSCSAPKPFNAPAGHMSSPGYDSGPYRPAADSRRFPTMFTSRKVGRDDSWEGIVINKSRGMLDGSNMCHFVEVRLGDGEVVKVRISRRLWKSMAVDDRIVKRPGADPVRG
ncbi:hypothetical protein [Streptomyces sp. NPDC053427]|uniref:DUF7489 domain-containing protein n=1 Tax=Streptomyces sp. NPDC053427 TaxID=3365701 RepID=UPI0037D9733F